VRILSVWSPIRNVVIRNVRGGCHVHAINMDGARGCLVPLFDPSDPLYQAGVGQVENMSIRGLHVHKSRPTSTALLECGLRLHNFVLEDFERDSAPDQAPACPSIALRHHAARTLTLFHGKTDDIESRELAPGSETFLHSDHFCKLVLDSAPKPAAPPLETR
jgi:hypothetical protein